MTTTRFLPPPRALPMLAGGLVFLLAALHGCRPELPDITINPPEPKPDTLPPITHTGANTFGCLVNGKVWVPKADWKAYFDPTFVLLQSAITEKNPGGGYITANIHTDSAQQEISLGVLCKEGVFHTNSLSNSDPDRFGIWLSDLYNDKFYSPADIGVVSENRLEIFHLDTVNNIISGTFKFKLFKSTHYGEITNYKDSLVVTEGRFDIWYNH